MLVGESFNHLEPYSLASPPAASTSVSQSGIVPISRLVRNSRDSGQENSCNAGSVENTKRLLLPGSVLHLIFT